MGYRAKLTTKIPQERRRTCTKCGNMGHLSTSCDAPEKRIDRIGIEIEGFWRDLPAAKQLAIDITGREGNSDGSISPRSSCRGDDADGDGCDCGEDNCSECTGRCPHQRRGNTCQICGMNSWEFQTKPGSLGEALRQLTQLYPDATSGACGMHVHLSFLDKSDVTMLTGDAFFEHFRAKIKEWATRANVRGAFWDRLAGDNQYCRTNNASDWHGAGLVTEAGERYKQVNFLAYSEHSTVEIRLLPMFQMASVGVSAVEALVEIVEEYLAREYSLDAASDTRSMKVIAEAGASKPVEAEIPTSLDGAARDALLPREIMREIEIADLSERTPGSVIVPAWDAARKATEMAAALAAKLAPVKKARPW